MKKLTILLVLTIWLCGCASMQVKTPKALILQEDRVYTIPAGQEVNVELDNVPTKITFSEPMKITTIDHILREEKKLNNAVLDKAGADKSRNKWIGLLGSLLVLVSSGAGIILKSKKEKP